jgi:hypothetical protein
MSALWTDSVWLLVVCLFFAAIGVICLAAAALVRAFRKAARIDARTKPPAPGQPQNPPEAAAPAARRNPVLRAAPAPGWTKVPVDGIYGQLVMASYFYDTGITVTDDLVRYRRMVDVPPPEDDDIAEFLGGEVPGDGV